MGAPKLRFSASIHRQQPHQPPNPAEILDYDHVRHGADQKCTTRVHRWHLHRSNMQGCGAGECFVLQTWSPNSTIAKCPCQGRRTARKAAFIHASTYAKTEPLQNITKWHSQKYAHAKYVPRPRKFRFKMRSQTIEQRWLGLRHGGARKCIKVIQSAISNGMRALQFDRPT